MAGVVRTLSPRMPLDRAERITRSSLDHDDAAVWTASAGDPRQTEHLRRLYRRLEHDPALDCFCRPRPDGAMWLSVIRRGQRPGGWWGEPKIG